MEERLKELLLFDRRQHDLSCGVTMTGDLGNCDCKKSELITKLMALIATHEKQIWERIKSGEGFSKHDGCIEVHPDYCDEQIANLTKSIERGE